MEEICQWIYNECARITSEKLMENQNQCHTMVANQQQQNAAEVQTQQNIVDNNINIMSDKVVENNNVQQQVKSNF